MNASTRRRILTAIAAVPTVALPAIAGADRHDAHLAIEEFQQADAAMRAAVERVRTMTASLKAAEAELAHANTRYDTAAVEVARVLRLILQAHV
jgi:hypothetical protein